MCICALSPTCLIIKTNWYLYKRSIALRHPPKRLCVQISSHKDTKAARSKTENVAQTYIREPQREINYLAAQLQAKAGRRSIVVRKH